MKAETNFLVLVAIFLRLCVKADIFFCTAVTLFGDGKLPEPNTLYSGLSIYCCKRGQFFIHHGHLKHFINSGHGSSFFFV
jgi:hypothetical protein